MRRGLGVKLVLVFMIFVFSFLIPRILSAYVRQHAKFDIVSTKEMELYTGYHVDLMHIQSADIDDDGFKDLLIAGISMGNFSLYIVDIHRSDIVVVETPLRAQYWIYLGDACFLVSKDDSYFVFNARNNSYGLVPEAVPIDNLFDFDGDGVYEFVFIENSHLQVFDPATLSIRDLFELPPLDNPRIVFADKHFICIVDSSGTLYEFDIKGNIARRVQLESSFIAAISHMDLDGDLNVETLLISRRYEYGHRYLMTVYVVDGSNVSYKATYELPVDIVGLNVISGDFNGDGNLDACFYFIIMGTHPPVMGMIVVSMSHDIYKSTLIRCSPPLSIPEIFASADIDYDGQDELICYQGKMPSSSLGFIDLQTGIYCKFAEFDLGLATIFDYDFNGKIDFALVEILGTINEDKLHVRLKLCETNIVYYSLDPPRAPSEIVDNDMDTLNDYLESDLGLSASSRDSDRDGLPDGWEFRHGLSPLVPDDTQDADNDGLSNREEYQLGTNPQAWDSDYDAFPDGLDIAPLRFNIEIHVALVVAICFIAFRFVNRLEKQ